MYRYRLGQKSKAFIGFSKAPMITVYQKTSCVILRGCLCVHIGRAEHWLFFSCSHFWSLGLSLNLELNELAKAPTQPVPGLGLSL